MDRTDIAQGEWNLWLIWSYKLQLEEASPYCPHVTIRGKFVSGHQQSILPQKSKAQFQKSQIAFDYFVKSIGPVVNKWTNF